jgi:hypothetical protein
MATVYATGDGAWGTVIPAYNSGDIVELGSNGGTPYTVSVDLADITVPCTIQNTAGGLLTITTTRNITANLTNIGRDAGILVIATAGITVTINGTVTTQKALTVGNALGINMTAAATLVINNVGGNAIATNGSRAIALRIAAGTCTVNGNGSFTGAAAGGYGVFVLTAGTACTINGNITCGAGYAIGQSGGATYVNGNITATSQFSGCVSASGGGFTRIVGNVTGVTTGNSLQGMYPSANDVVIVTGTATLCNVYTPGNGAFVAILGNWTGSLWGGGINITVITAGSVPSSWTNNGNWFHFGTPALMPASPGRHWLLPALSDVRLSEDVLKEVTANISMLTGTRSAGPVVVKG